MLLCLPDDRGRDLVGEPPDGVEVIVWDGSGDPPDGVEATEFWVPPYATAAVEAFPALPAVRVVQLLSAGYDPWRSIVPQGVVLCTAQGVHGTSTAELAIAGLLALLRRIPDLVHQQANRRWEPVETDELAGRSALLLGAGDIGCRVAERLRAFDVDVTLVGRTPREGVHGHDEVPSLLPSHDIVVLATPLTPDTTGLVDAAFLAALPTGALVINVSRGGVVDTGALLAELRSGRLRAFLDVTDPEPLPSDHPLWTAPGVLISPHIGGGTPGWAPRAYRLVREQVSRYVAGEPLANVVGD